MLNFNKRNDDDQPKNVTPHPTAPFAKRLRWAIEHSNDTWQKIEITPAMATEMLTWNDRNRPWKPGAIKKYAAEMAAGNWVYTRVPIVFSPERLLDGQHRLVACEASGISFVTDVAFGAPDDAFYNIDVGTGRSGADIFAINGVPNWSMAAASTRFVMSYDAGRQSGDAAITSGSFRPTHRELYDAYLGYERMQDSIKVGYKFSHDRLPSPSVAAGCHYICARKNRAAADEYFEKVCTGIGFSSKRDPAYKVRDYLTRDVEATLRQSHVACALLLGWNATRTKKPLGKITTEKLPRAI